MNRLAVLLILLLAFCGLADSAYLAQHETDGTPLICDIAGLSDCNIVAQSPYAKAFGIPLSDYGLVFYGLIFLLAAIELALGNRITRQAIQVLSALGLIASAYFLFIQLAVINALCVYYTASAVIAFLIFICAYFIEPLPRRGTINLPPPSARSPLVLPPPMS